MNYILIKQSMMICFLLLPLAIFCQQQFYKPQRYEEFVTKTITSLETRKKSIESKMAQLKNPLAKKTQLTAFAQRNQGLFQSLTASGEHITQRLKVLNEEKDKLKNNTLGIKDSADEDLFIRKAALKNRVDNLSQQLLESQSVEQFFETQKHGKTKAEIDDLEKEKNDFKQKRSRLEQKLRSAQADLQNLK